MRRILIGLLVAAVASPCAQGAAPEADAQNVSNWTAPPYWSGREAPASGEPGDRSSGRSAEGRTALTSGPVALPFIALPPCRLVDTRDGAPLTSGFLPPATVGPYVASVCGVPANTKAISRTRPP